MKSKDPITSAFNTYQTRHEFKQISKLTIYKPDITDSIYVQLVQDCENYNYNILCLLENILQSEIQNIFYTLKPRQILYDSICGLLSFVAGLDKALPTEFLFQKCKDWVSVSSFYCQHYDLVIAQIRNLQQSLIKKKITPINIKEARAYLNDNNLNTFNKDKLRTQSIDNKLHFLLGFSLCYYDTYHSIEKYHQQYLIKQSRAKTQPSESAEKSVSVESYLENKMKDHFVSVESDELSEQNKTEVKVSFFNEEPAATLAAFKTYSEYQSHHKNSPNILNISRQSQAVTTTQQSSPLQFNTTARYKPFHDIDITLNLKNGSTKSPNSTNKKSRTPVESRTPNKFNADSLDQKSTISFGKVMDEKARLMDVERMIKQDIEMAKRQVIRLEKTRNRLFWEESKAVNQKLNKQKINVNNEILSAYQTHSEETNKYLNQVEQQEKRRRKADYQFKLSLISNKAEFTKQQDCGNNVIKLQELRSLQKELKLLEEQKVAIEKDNRNLYRMVCEL